MKRQEKYVIFKFNHHTGFYQCHQDTHKRAIVYDTLWQASEDATSLEDRDHDIMCIVSEIEQVRL